MFRPSTAAVTDPLTRDFEAGLGPLVMGFLPSIVARSAYLARKKVHEVLRPYYEGTTTKAPTSATS